MTEQQILEKLQEWLLDRVGMESDGSTNYLDSGALDSFDIICFVSYIEGEFEIQLQVEDLQSQDFNTLVGLARLISLRRSR